MAKLSHEIEALDRVQRDEVDGISSPRSLTSSPRTRNEPRINAIKLAQILSDLISKTESLSHSIANNMNEMNKKLSVIETRLSVLEVVYDVPSCQQRLNNIATTPARTPLDDFVDG